MREERQLDRKQGVLLCVRASFRMIEREREGESKTETDREGVRRRRSQNHV